MLLRNRPGCGVTTAISAEGDLIYESGFGQRVLIPLRKSLPRSCCPRCQSEVSRRIPSRALSSETLYDFAVSAASFAGLAAARIRPSDL